jgi:hypothetical protein
MPKTLTIPCLLLTLIAPFAMGQGARTSRDSATVGLNKSVFSGHSPLAHQLPGRDRNCKTCDTAPGIEQPPGVLATGPNGGFHPASVSPQFIMCNVDATSPLGQELSKRLATLEMALKPALGESWNLYLTAEQNKFGSGICQEKVDTRQETLTVLHGLNAPGL